MISSTRYEMMNSKSLRLETILYIVALGLGMAVRMYNLGVQPLSDSEAQWALQALHLAQGETFSPGPQPAYISLTALVFFLFGGTDALARLWPAIFGSALVLLPILWRPYLGRVPALLLAFGLALDPGLTALSRQAGGPMMAISFTWLALGCLATRRLLLATICALGASLSGLAGFHGLLLTALVFVISGLLSRWGFPRWEWQTRGVEDNEDLRRNILVGVSGVVLVMGTLFFVFPEGLGAWMATLPKYLGNWLQPSGISPLLLLVALVVFQPLALLFGLAAIFHRRKVAAPVHFLVLFATIAFTIALINPGRQVGDLAWVLVPLWALAAIALSRLLSSGTANRGVVFGQATLVFILLALSWLSVLGLNQTLSGQQVFYLRLGIIVGVLALGGLTTFLISMGWSWEAARSGLAWGLVASFGVFVLANLWSVSQEPGRRPQNIWNPFPVAGDASLLLDTIEDISVWSTGRIDAAEILVAVDEPSMRWLMRDFPNARFAPAQQALAPSEAPVLVITRQEQDSPALAASYRGQDFAWWLWPGWNGAYPPDLTRWLAFREAPVSREYIILWARDDIFPGGVSQASGEPDLEAIGGDVSR